MSAPTSKDPLFVNTAGGQCWKRQHVDGDGRGLYALADVVACPAYVLASFAELAELGISGSADVLPVPVGPEPQEVDADTVAARAAQVISAMGAELRGLKKESDRLFLAWGSARMRSRRKNEALKKLKARVAELEKREAAVAEFAAKRAEYITAIRNCHPDNGHDYDRWQGHAAARRQLSELLGLPVAWPLEGGVPAPRLAHVQREPEGEHYAQAHHDYRVPRDLPETGGTQ